MEAETITKTEHTEGTDVSLARAPATLERFNDHVTRLYEQGADVDCIGEYSRHWERWVRSGVPALSGQSSGL
jgi:hypothetical protein